MTVTLFDFAFNNIKRDFGTYFYHFLSCVFSVLIFFLFMTLAQHPALAVVSSGSTIGLVLSQASLISMIFSFILILYSVGNFLKNRSKQFAILNIIGASKKQFTKLIFLENMILSAVALFLGIILGIIFSKLFLMIAQSLIDGLNLYFYFPVKALIFTIILMGGLFFVVALLAPVIMRKKKVIDLLKKEEVAEKNHFVFSLFAFVVITPLTIYFHLDSDIPLFAYPLELLFVISTSYFLFYLIFMGYQFVIEHSKKRYAQNNLIKLSNFKYKINTNVKTMAGAMILFGVILTAFVYIVGAPRNVTDDTKKFMPYTYMYANWESKVDGEKKAVFISNYLARKDHFKELTISYAQLPSETRTTRHIVLSNTMYNAIADFLNRDKIDLTDNEYFLVGVDGKKAPKLSERMIDKLAQYDITKERGADKRIIALSGYFTSVTVVSDSKYQKLLSEMNEDKIYAFEQVQYRNDTAVEVDDLQKEIDFKMDQETFMSYYSYYSYENMIRNLIAYVGSILCIAFLIGIASIIYTRLYSLADEESKKYSIMMKLGVSKKEIKSILSSTVRWILVLPFGVALILSFGVITLIDRETLTSYTNLALICGVSNLSIELLIYAIINRKYQEKVFDMMYKL